MQKSEEIAAALLAIGAVGFVPSKPITFKSGIISPVYVDNRRFPFHPQEWKKVLTGFAALIAEQKLEYDVIAGIETAGIPHSAALGYVLQMPSVFVRKQVKDHGTKSRIEGGNVRGRRVLLLEDHITTGGSSLSGVQALRDEGALVVDCIAISSYEFQEARDAFSEAGVSLHTLVSFADILDVATKSSVISLEEKAVVEGWFQDPRSWGTA